MDSTLDVASREDKIYFASQWQLIFRRFRKHKLAIIGGITLGIFYVTMGLFCEFFSPTGTLNRFKEYTFCPPQRVRFVDENGKFHIRPFVFGLKPERHPVTFKKIYLEDKTARYPIKFFVQGDEYKLWSLFKANMHFVGVEKPGVLLLFGTDSLGRDLLSRTMYAARVSLSVGLVGVTLSFVLGCFLGGISGYYGGPVDTIIQRLIEFLVSIPVIPLWMALAAAVPIDWPPLRVYFGITIILSIVGWCGLARVVRGKLIAVREEEFVVAAQISNIPVGSIIGRHLLPSFMSYLIVNLTLAIPSMILGETALSFLGLGIRTPAVSWGVLLKDAQNVKAVSMHPWLLIPAAFVIITVLAFNLLGDGLRDAADPYG